MAQKKKPAVDPMRVKAAQMRQAQERADRRIRIVVISAVAIIVLAVVAAVGGVIWEQQAQVDAVRNVDAFDVPGACADGRPIIVSVDGVVTETDPNLPTLIECFDYSCHACADLDAYLGEDLTTQTAEGHYNLELQPVITVNMDYLKPVASASLAVAQKAPDKWVDFHHTLFAYFRTQYQASNGTVVQNLDASWKQAKVIAAEAGVPSDVIDTFPINTVKDYPKASTTAWRNAGYSGRGDSLGTLELIRDRSTVIPLGTQLPALRETIAQEYGITGSTSQDTSQTPAPEVTEPSQSGADGGQSSETTDSSN